ncbi:MAG: hypothetical protein KDD22_07185 [Bdellovibrionales bacterium]|nr:hypothetical protein [Bdellovibrionales bacterium]
MNWFAKLFGIFSLLIFGGCQSAPKITELGGEGVWSGTAQIKDLKTNKTRSLNLEIYAIKGSESVEQKLRLEGSAFMGTPVIALVADPQNTTFVLFQSKAYYDGPTSAQVFKPLLHLPLHPSWVVNLLFAEPFRGHGWSCSFDEKKSIRKCQQKESHLEASWKTNEVAERKIQIHHPKAEINLTLKMTQPKVEDKEQVFTLHPPTSFRRLAL